MKIVNIILSSLLSLLVTSTPYIAYAQIEPTSSPSPDGYELLDSSGRPPDALAAKAEECSCTCPPPAGSFSCILYRPPDTRTCTQACKDEEPMKCHHGSSAAYPMPSPI